jgi:hypothetical protein
MAWVRSCNERETVNVIGLALFIAGLLLAGLFLAARRPGADLAADYAQRCREATQQLPEPAAALASADIADLPLPVQRYLHRSGAIGKPPVRSVRVAWDAEMFKAPGHQGMPGPAAQVDVLQPPRRLFFMSTRMFGLPVAVLHDYAGTTASMRVRVARLFDVVNRQGTDLARTETVTLLNDLCFLAPSALAGPQFAWQTVDDQQAQLTFTCGPHTVHATLVFDGNGDLVDFLSDDRGETQSDGTPQRLRWSTPMRNIQVFQGRRVPTRGEAIWHRPEGEFVYGRFLLRNIRFDETG